MKFTSATTSLFLSTLAVIASAASNVQNDINSLSDSLFTSLSLPDSFDDAKQNELLETMSNIDVLLMGAEHADSSLVRDIGPAEEPAPPTPAVDRKDLKKKIDKKVNKLNNIFESGKIFKSTPSVSEGEQKAHKAKLLEKTLDRAVTLSQQSSFARFHAKMQSGMDSFFDKVMNNPRAR